jgi:hypothetical protein
VDDVRHTRLTPDEQQTQMTLWAMVRSPLIAGANLTLLDEATLRLLTNPDMVQVDQTATASRQVMHEGDLVVWTADLPTIGMPLRCSTLEKRLSRWIAISRIPDFRKDIG